MSRKFNATLSIRGDQVESNPISVSLTPIPPKKEKDYAYLDMVSIHGEKDVTENTQPDCWLQIWELDYYKTKKTLTTEETDLNPPENRCLVSFQGIVIKAGGKYVFRAVGTMSFARTEESPLNGKIKVQLTSGTKEPTTDDVIVHLPEYEGLLELAAVIRVSDDCSFGANQELTPDVFLQNIEASIRRQLEERIGIAVAFVTDYKGSNLEFGNQASEMLASLPTFKLNDTGDIRMGYHVIGSYADIADKMRELINSISATYAIPKDEIFIANLCMYGHGIAQKIQIEYDPKNAENYSLPGSLDVAKVNTFVNQILPFLSEFIVVTFNACACGRSYSAGPPSGPGRFVDTRFGNPYPCEMLGEDSLGLTMFRELTRQNILYPCVWAHTTAGHATRNPNLRVFCSRGSADLPHLLFKTRNCTLSAADFRRHFGIPKDSKHPSYKSLTHNANLLRRVCQQNALYFDWNWLDGKDGGDLPEGASINYSIEANEILSKIRGLLPQTVRENEDSLVYSDDTRGYITGLADGVDDTDLSEDFTYSNINTLCNPVFVSVTLLKMAQLLRDRVRKIKHISSLTLLSISSNGKSLTLQPAPATHANAVAVSGKAQEMLRQGYIAATNLSNNIITLEV